MFSILASFLLENYISLFKVQNKPFQYILLDSLSCEIDQSYFIQNVKRTEEYRGSQIINFMFDETPILSYHFLQEDSQELKLYFPSVGLKLSVIDHYYVTEKLLMFEKFKEMDIERNFRYKFEEVFLTVPLKSESFELFVEKITFAIYDYMEDMARDIMNGELLSEEGLLLQLDEWQVDKMFDNNLLLFEP